MKIIVDGTPKEIAALVLELQERQTVDVKSLSNDVVIRLQESLTQASQASLQ